MITELARDHFRVTKTALIEHEPIHYHILPPTVTALIVGTINPGGTGTQTVYVKNTGNVAETLTMTTNNWAPSGAGSSLTLNCNRQSTVLAAGASIQAILTLTAASNTGTITTFSCDVILTGTQ